jgi:hypothetical protein
MIYKKIDKKKNFCKQLFYCVSKILTINFEFIFMNEFVEFYFNSNLLQILSYSNVNSNFILNSD